jgi:methionyl-tRNA formyltransferase
LRAPRSSSRHSRSPARRHRGAIHPTTHLIEHTDMATSRVIFWGSSDFGIACLDHLHAHYTLAAVVTSPDAPKGRKLVLSPTPVKEWAVAHNVRVLSPTRLGDACLRDELKAMAPDFFVVASYGRFLPAPVFSLPASGTLNVHPSLLPKYRGAAPMEWTLIRGERTTGVSIITMDRGVDTGRIIVQHEMPVAPDDDCRSLKAKLMAQSFEALEEAIIRRKAGDKGRIQEGEVSHAPKLKKEDGHVRWEGAATDIANLVRGLVVWPGAYTFVVAAGSRRVLKIRRASVAAARDQAGNPGTFVSLDEGIRIACGKGVLSVERLQLEGKRELGAEEFLRGHRRHLEDAVLQ